MSVASEIGCDAANSHPDITAKCSHIDQKNRDSVKNHPVKNAVMKKLYEFLWDWDDSVECRMLQVPAVFHIIEQKAYC